jgi:hypothetical protein
VSSSTSTSADLVFRIHGNLFLVSRYFEKSIAPVTGFNSKCKSKVTVTSGGGSSCKAPPVTGDAFSSAFGTVLDYMKLAECRRRMYRPLPLDEFGYTLPYALNYQVTGLIEMGEDATIQNVPVRGSTWMDNWIKTLWGYDPILIPVSTSASRSTGTNATAMNLAPQCPAAQTKTKRTNVGSKATGSPFARTRGVASSTFSGSVQRFICTNPTWDDQISRLFNAPYWLEEPERSKVGQSWIRAMRHWGVNLDLEKYDDVKQKATSIYRHMIRRSMPLTDDPNHYFPDDAIETYRL